MKRWLKYACPYLPYFILGPLCMIIEVIGEVLFPRLLAVVINRGTEGTLTVGDSLWVCVMMILLAVVPFNLLKGVVLSAVTMVLYKRIAPLLKNL